MNSFATPMLRLAAGIPKRLSILIFHRVLAEADPMRPYDPTAAVFARQLDWLGSVFDILPLAEAIDALAEDRLPARAAAITFDDGYRDNLEVATPLLNAKGMPATFFLTTAWLDGGMMFNDVLIETARRWPGPRFQGADFGLDDHELATDEERVRCAEAWIRTLKHLPFEERARRVQTLAGRVDGLPAGLMMNAEEIRRLRHAGMAIGGHTHAHPILATLPPEEAEWQIGHNKSLLENILGERLRLFAYPNGKPGQDYRLEHAEMVRRLGYDAAVSTAPGCAGAAADPYQLPRFTPWDQSPTRYLARLTQLRFQPGFALA